MISTLQRYECLCVSVCGLPDIGLCGTNILLNEIFIINIIYNM